MFCSHKFLIIFQEISLLILSLHKYQITFGFKSTVKVCFLINFDNFWEVFEHTVLFYWESPKPCLCSKMALFMMFWQIFKLLLQLSPLNSYLPYLRAFQWGNVWPYGLVRKVLNSQKAQNSFLWSARSKTPVLILVHYGLNASFDFCALWVHAILCNSMRTGWPIPFEPLFNS